MNYIKKTYTYSSGIIANAFVIDYYMLTTNYNGNNTVTFKLSPYININAYKTGLKSIGDGLQENLNLQFTVDEATLDLTAGHLAGILLGLTDGTIVSNTDASFFVGGSILPI